MQNHSPTLSPESLEVSCPLDASSPQLAFPQRTGFCWREVAVLALLCKRQNNGMISVTEGRSTAVGRDHWRSSSPSPLLEKVPYARLQRKEC